MNVKWLIVKVSLLQSDHLIRFSQCQPIPVSIRGQSNYFPIILLPFSFFLLQENPNFEMFTCHAFRNANLTIWASLNTPMHYGLSPVGNRKLRKTHLGFHFLAIHIFQTEIFEISFTFVWFWVRVETHLSSSRIFTRISWNSSRLAEGCEKVRGRVEKTLK